MSVCFCRQKTNFSVCKLSVWRFKSWQTIFQTILTQRDEILQLLPTFLPTTHVLVVAVSSRWIRLHSKRTLQFLRLISLSCRIITDVRKVRSDLLALITIKNVPILQFLHRKTTFMYRWHAYDTREWSLSEPNLHSQVNQVNGVNDV